MTEPTTRVDRVASTALRTIEHCLGDDEGGERYRATVLINQYRDCPEGEKNSTIGSTHGSDHEEMLSLLNDLLAASKTVATMIGLDFNTIWAEEPNQG